MIKVGDREGLEALLAEPVAEQRIVAVQALGSLRQKASIPALIRTLGDEELQVRRAAAGVLVAFGERAVPALVDSLQGQGGRLAPYALWALGEIGSSAALDALRAAAQSRSWRLRWSAVEALGDVGGAQAIGLLVEALCDRDERVRNAAGQALLKIGSPAVDALRAALRHPDPGCRAEAAGILRRMDDPAAAEALRRQQLFRWIPVVGLGAGLILILVWLASMFFR